MALVSSLLEIALKKAFKDSLNVLASTYPGLDGKLNESAEKFASLAADAIDTYIKSATIIVPPGQSVTTTGGAGATSTPSLPATIS